MQHHESIPFAPESEPLTDADFTDEFWLLFPDGNVPIRYVPMGTSFVEEWPEFMRKFDAAQAFDVARIDDLAGQWMILFHSTKRGGTVDNAGKTRIQARDEAFDVARQLRDVTLELMGMGLSLHAIARYLGVPPRVVAEAYSMHHGVADALLAADELAGDERITSEEIARRSGYSPAAVRKLRAARGVRADRLGVGNLGRDDYNDVMARADELFEQGYGRKAAVKIIHAERPDTQEWLTIGILQGAQKRWRKRQQPRGDAAIAA